MPNGRDGVCVRRANGVQRRQSDQFRFCRMSVVDELSPLIHTRREAIGKFCHNSREHVEDGGLALEDKQGIGSYYGLETMDRHIFPLSPFAMV